MAHPPLTHTTSQLAVHGEAYQQICHQPAAKAGDVIMFSEATVHGTRPWTSDAERRAVLYRFAPANMAYGKAYTPAWPKGMSDRMDEQQRAVLEPPYSKLRRWRHR